MKKPTSQDQLGFTLPQPKPEQAPRKSPEEVLKPGLLGLFRQGLEKAPTIEDKANVRDYWLHQAIVEQDLPEIRFAIAEVFNKAISLHDLFDEILGPVGKGAPGKKGEQLTPTRISHMTELLQMGVFPSSILKVEQYVNASGWLNKPVRSITEKDIEQLCKNKPWYNRSGKRHAENDQNFSMEVDLQE